MATNTKSTTTSSNTRLRRLPNARMIQNFHLVWLDRSIDETNDDYHDSITKFREVVNTVNTFADIDECIDFVTDIKENGLMVISEDLSQTIISIIQDISQLNRVYIFRKNNVQYQKWIKEWPKVAGVYTDITSICDALKEDTRNCDHSLVSISYAKKTDGTANQNLDTLDSSFMYTQILKEILLTINFEKTHFNEFITYCREQFVNNTTELKNIDKIEKEYDLRQPIWWYTYQCFLYSMLNRALRLMEVDLITKMGFFVRDLHEHIAKLHSEQYGRHHHSDSFVVYRGQGLSQVDFDQLQTTQGGLLAFNNFLSTSLNHDVSLRFARHAIDTSDKVGVLFMMKIDSSIPATPFANIKTASRYQGEEEILFSMHSVFRIGEMKQIEENSNRLWQVELTLTGDNDQQLQQLTKNMQEGTAGSTGWFRLGRLMMTVAQYDEAQHVFEMILNRTADEKRRAEIYHQLGYIKRDLGSYTEAITYYEKSLKILQTYFPVNHPDLASSYGSIGRVYDSMGNYSKALSYYETALEIKQKALPANHPHLASYYNNIGMMYYNVGEYSKALSYHEKACEIFEKTLPANHPDLANSYNNIGQVYDKLGDYSKALSYYEKALKIRQRTLPANHPDLASSYNNIGVVYLSLGEYSKALSYHEKDLEICQKTLPENHPDLAASYNNIAMVYDSMGEYSKAVLYYDKALEIKQKTLTANHPHLAISYNNIGMVYYNVGEYSKALFYYDKAREIFEKTLPANHPYLANSYNSIGHVYKKLGDYSKALLYYEKDLEIRQKTLPANHLDLAHSYSNIGMVCLTMRNWSKSLSCFEHALDIQQRSLPSNHPDLGQTKKMIAFLTKIVNGFCSVTVH